MNPSPPTYIGLWELGASAKCPFIFVGFCTSDFEVSHWILECEVSSCQRPVQPYIAADSLPSALKEENEPNYCFMGPASHDERSMDHILVLGLWTPGTHLG